MLNSQRQCCCVGTAWQEVPCTIQSTDLRVVIKDPTKSLAACSGSNRCCDAGLVKSRPLDRWKETLALLAAYSEGEEFFGLCDLLAKRLAGAGLPGPATLAWICAANVDKAVRQWTRDLKASAPEPSAEALQVRLRKAT